MTYLEFKRHLGKAGLSVQKFAALIGVRATSISNYCKRGVVPIQHAVLAITLGELVDRKVNVFELLRRHGAMPTQRRARDKSVVHQLDDYRSRTVVDVL